MRHVHAETVHAAVQPESEHVVELGADLLVLPVQVGLVGVEQVQVPLPGGAVRFGDPGPGAAAEHAFPVGGRLLTGLAAPVAEDVPVPLCRARGSGQGSLEPLVVVGGVVGHQVHDHPQPELVGTGEEGGGVGQVAEPGVDLAVVGHVVAGVVLGGGVERGQPDRVHAEFAQVVQLGGDSRQVADPVAVRIGEGAGVDLVDHRGTPPFGIRSRRAVDQGARGLVEGAERHRCGSSHRAIVVICWQNINVAHRLGW